MFTDRELQALKSREKDCILVQKARQWGRGPLALDTQLPGHRAFYFQRWVEGTRRFLKTGNFSNAGTGLALSAGQECMTAYSCVCHDAGS